MTKMRILGLLGVFHHSCALTTSPDGKLLSRVLGPLQLNNKVLGRILMEALYSLLLRRAHVFLLVTDTVGQYDFLVSNTSQSFFR